ncbi:hypothetical protein FHG87_019751 [Trinorchestia longiramus]|nr:hypothetical protein FHG87_019751 [Trinorchestia longiramus]
MSHEHEAPHTRRRRTFAASLAREIVHAGHQATEFCSPVSCVRLCPSSGYLPLREHIPPLSLGGATAFSDAPFLSKLVSLNRQGVWPNGAQREQPVGGGTNPVSNRLWFLWSSPSSSSTPSTPPPTLASSRNTSPPPSPPLSSSPSLAAVATTLATSASSSPSAAASHLATSTAQPTVPSISSVSTHFTLKYWSLFLRVQRRSISVTNPFY